MIGAFETGKYRNLFVEYGYDEQEVEKMKEFILRSEAIWAM